MKQSVHFWILVSIRQYKKAQKDEKIFLVQHSANLGKSSISRCICSGNENEKKHFRIKCLRKSQSIWGNRPNCTKAAQISELKAEEEIFAQKKRYRIKVRLNCIEVKQNYDSEVYNQNLNPNIPSTSGPIMSQCSTLYVWIEKYNFIPECDKYK